DARLAETKAELARTTPERDAALAKWAEEAAKGDLKKLPKPVAAILAVPPAQRTPQHKEALAAHWRTLAPELEAQRKAVAEAQGERDRLTQQVPTTLVSTSGPPRTMRVLPRGNWLDDTGEVVGPAVPAFLSPLPAKDRPTRLDLAKWLVSRDNPLTARVFVNRLWKVCFGQ